MTKKKLFWQLMVALMLLVVGLGRSGGIAAAAPVSANGGTAVLAALRANSGTAVVTTGALNVRTGPGIAYNAFAVLFQGHTVTLLGRNSAGSWVQVRLSTGQTGWVHASLIQASVAISTLPVTETGAAPAPSTAVVTTGALNVRSGPGIGYGVVTVVRQGNVVTLIGRNSVSSWAQVRLAGGQVGWVNAALIQPNVALTSLPVTETAAPPAAGTGTVATGALNLRSGPAVNYAIVTTLQYGQTVTLLARNSASSWAQVRSAGGHVGWVHAAYLQTNVAISSLPVAGAPAATHTAIVATGTLNVRSGPGVGYAITSWVTQGQAVTLLGRNNASSWAQIRLANGHVGWVNAGFLQPSVSIGSLPVTW
jgi:uncharacterized protein YgiM (DUF1202 family)